MNSIQHNEARTNGRWTTSEHQKFLLGLQLYGKNWKKIEEIIGTRTGSQIRSHAQKYFLRLKNPECFSNDLSRVEDSHAEHQTPAVKVDTNQKKTPIQAEHSYYLTRILQLYKVDKQRCFWEELVDVDSTKNAHEIQNMKVQRKDSFISFDMCYDSKQETALSCAPNPTEIL